MSTDVAAEMAIIDARNKLTSLPEKLQRRPGAISVTRRGEPVLAILPWDLYEAIVETLEILGDDEQMAALRRGIKESDAGKTIPWEKARKRL